MHNTSNELRRLIRAEMDAQGVTTAELAKRVGLDRSSVSGLLTRSTDLRVGTADKLARALGRVIVYRLEPTP